MKLSITFLFALAGTLSFGQKSSPALEILSSSNDEKVLFRGINNVVEIKTAAGDSTDYYILGSNCYVTRIKPTGEKLPENQYIIKPGKNSHSNINIAVTENGVSKMLSRETFEIKDVPDPIIYLDTYKSGDALSRDVEWVQVRCSKDSGINAQFDVTEWTMIINGSIYKGNSHIVTPEVSNLLKKVPSGTKIEMTVTSDGIDGVSRKYAAEFTVK